MLISIIMYIILVFVVIVIGIVIYIKWNFRFWSSQPVFHIYDFHYYFFPPGIINKEITEKNRYCNFENIKVLNMHTMEDYKWTMLMHFIQKHYIQNKDNKFTPKRENIEPYFAGHNSKCLLSMYIEEDTITDTKTQNIGTRDKLVSVMTTRPLHVTINNGNSDADFYVYYVDYLCVDKKYRKRGIAPQIIQTHEYMQRRMSKDIIISLFKREGELTGIVPLCVYDSYGFEMDKWPNASDLPHPLQIIEVGKTNIDIFFHFFQKNKKKYDIVLTPEISNILALVTSENIYIYLMIQNDDVIAAYIFKRSCTTCKNEMDVLSSIASINCCKDDDIYINGFKIAIDKVREKHSSYGYCVLEDISDNNIIINNIQTHFVADSISPTAYFFYNFAYPTFDSKKVFLIE